MRIWKVRKGRGKELVTTQSYMWSVLGEFTKDLVAFQES